MKRILHPKHNQAKFKHLLRKYKDAAQLYIFIGATHPDDHDEIRKNYTRTRRDLISFVLMFIK